MKLLKKSVLVWVLILTIVAISSIAVATIMIYKEVSISMEIQGVYKMIILDTDKETELTAIAFGVLHRGDTERYPATGSYWIYNTGEKNIFLSYSLTDFPADASLTMHIKKDTEETFNVLVERGIYPYDLYELHYYEWYIEISVDSTAALASYNPVLTWNAHDSAAG